MPYKILTDYFTGSDNISVSLKTIIKFDPKGTLYDSVQKYILQNYANR